METVQPATFVREIAVLQHAFEVAKKEWRYPLRNNPVKGIKKPKVSQADVKKVIACWILGHQPSKETQTVGDMVYTHSRPDLKKLYKAICKVKYNIDFSHLYME